MSEGSQVTTSNNSRLKSILIYLGIGIVVYGIIYYVLFYKRSETATPEETLADIESSIQLPEVQAEVNLTENGPEPADVTISAGTMVQWTNSSGEVATINSANHPDHEENPLLNLGEVGDGDSMSLVFEETGTYEYHMEEQPNQPGTVTVE